MDKTYAEVFFLGDNNYGYVVSAIFGMQIIRFSPGNGFVKLKIMLIRVVRPCDNILLIIGL